MSPRHRPLLLALGFTAAALAAISYFVWTTHRPSDLRNSLANGYATQSLTAPFTLANKSWDAKSANMPAPAAIAAAKAQFAKGAYQVDSRHPDAVSAGSATLYRDLITEDVALAAQIDPNPAVNGKSPATLVKVTLGSMRQ